MQYRIALIPGDGIGPEVVNAGVQVLEAVAAVCDFTIAWTDFPYSCTYYLEHGVMIPEDGFEALRQHDAIRLCCKKVEKGAHTKLPCAATFRLLPQTALR